MNQRRKETIPNFFTAVVLPAAVLSLLGFLLASTLVGPPPPKKLVFAGGSSWGAYYRFGQQYAEILDQRGVKLEVLETRGSTDNLRLLEEGKADIALVQGGVTRPEAKVTYRCLGSTYLEPLWIFSRERRYTMLTQLKGKRLAVGSEGSGTRAIAVQLLEDNGILDQVSLEALGGEPGAQALKAGRVDALFLVGSYTIPVIEALLNDPDIHLASFERSKAYVMRHHFLSRVTLPRGVIDVARDIPRHDIQLVAPAATLVVRDDFHQALVSVILEAGTTIHGSGGILARPGEFPQAAFCTYPVADEARLFYRYGASFLYRHLPFHFASVLERAAIFILPFVGLLIPLTNFLPRLYGWTMRRKIDRYYRALQDIEDQLEADQPRGPLVARLLEIEVEIYELGTAMPASYGSALHALRIHYERVKARSLKEVDM